MLRDRKGSNPLLISQSINAMKMYTGRERVGPHIPEFVVGQRCVVRFVNVK